MIIIIIIMMMMMNLLLVLSLLALGHWDTVHVQWNKIKCWFVRRVENRSTRRKTSRSRVESQQQTQLTYDAESGNQNRVTLLGGECSHHCTILAFITTISREVLHYSKHRWFGTKNITTNVCPLFWPHFKVWSFHWLDYQLITFEEQNSSSLLHNLCKITWFSFESSIKCGFDSVLQIPSNSVRWGNARYLMPRYKG